MVAVQTTADLVISTAAAVIAFICWNGFRSALIWVLTWGTGGYYADSSGNLFLSILYMIFVIAAGSLMISVVLKEIMENGTLCVIIGFAVSRLFITPVFSGASRLGYIALAFLLSIGFHLLYKWGAGRFLDDFDELTPLTYCFDGVFFLVSVSGAALLSYLYVRFLAC